MAGKSGRKPVARSWIRAALLATALAIGLWLPGRISVASTPSLGFRLFFLGKAGDRFEQGDYLLFRKHMDHAATDLLLKKVGCATGQRLTVNNDEYYCDGNYLGRALTQDSKGNRLPQFIFNGFVPAGSLFMVGNHPRSYDSKYFGFIHADSVLKKAYPIW